MNPFLSGGPDIPGDEPPTEELAPEIESVSGDYSQPTLRRVPNLAHALLFVSFAGLLLVLFQLALFILGELPASSQAGAITVEHPKLQIATQALAYLTTLLAAWLFYPLLWHRPFFEGVQWRWQTARDQAAKLIALGILLGTAMQLVTYFINPPKAMPIDNFFLTPADAWLITLFGTLVAPVFEEICFRGFLVPAFAIAYDWLSLPHTERARIRWQTTTTLTPVALLFSAILTSIFFAWMHAQQLAHLWAALLVLFFISLVLTSVRVKTQSVAASTVVHAAYNFFIFLLVLIETGGYRHLDRMSH